MTKLEKGALLAEETFRHFALLSWRGALEPPSDRMSDKIDNGAGAPPRRKGFLRPEGGLSPDQPSHIVTLRMWLRFETTRSYSLRPAPHNVESSSHARNVMRFCAPSGSFRLRMTAGG